MRKENLLKKLAKSVSLVILGFTCFMGGLLTKSGEKVQAYKPATHQLKKGDTYKIDDIKFKVTSYYNDGYKHIVITEDSQHARSYDIGSNDDKNGQSKGITLDLSREKMNK